ncbi:MinD/ParA family protein [Salinispira pacifica]|uniref:Flagellar synthesis regulator FleN n=1 Tax=Salinispira pacifica TaxID=1307761 RepID=V5WFP8_9SPIO|nr:MinD/ParA family protein [Salinispira pacifica]AHC14603.1 Flagellar synthesis regulator FleN [Salinispira pacifica]
MADQAEALREIMQGNSQLANSKTRIITVASGKGGVGKTNISTNLAIAYGKLGKRVVLMDADLGLANVNVVLGIIPKYNLYHLIRKQKTMKDILMDTQYGIQLVAGASGFSKLANLSEEERNNFIKELTELSSADVIIIDASAGVNNNVLSFIAAADDAIIVTTPEPTAITDAYGIIKIIATEIDNLGLSLKLIVNRVSSVTEGKKVAERVTNIASQFLNLKVDYLGYVFEDTAVRDAVKKQKPFSILEPRSKASACVQQLVSRLEKIEYREGGGLGNFLKKLFSR